MRKWLGLALAVAFAAAPTMAQVVTGKVAVVLDVGGRGDLSFNDMAFKGTDQAVAEFGLSMTEVQSATDADYLPNVRNLARTGEYDLIICVGFMLGDALAVAAEEFPEQKFAIVDVDYITGPNIMNLVFRENEMSALVGALGAMAAAHHGYPKLGVVFGMELPVLYHFEAGYRFGMDWGNQKYAALTGTVKPTELLYTYTGSFNDIALGKATMEAMLAQRVVAGYNVAGGLGIGMLEAVAEFHRNAGTRSGPPYFFGVDANQDWMGKGLHGLASGMKRVDVACYTAVASVVNGTFEPGVTSFGLIDRGVAISRYTDLVETIDAAIAAGTFPLADRDETIANWQANRATIPDWIWAAIDELEAGILNGTIAIPTANTLEEMRAIRALYTLGAP